MKQPFPEPSENKSRLYSMLETGNRNEMAIEDALNGLAYKDDSCITRLELIKMWDDTPEVVVTIRRDAQ